jgi:hypothetical protein
MKPMKSVTSEAHQSGELLAGEFLASEILGRIASLDWINIATELDAHGCAVIGPVLSSQQCEALAGSYDAVGMFRSRVVMARHGFGRGEYQYFSYPLPPVISALRTALYPPLARIANRWSEAMGIAIQYPEEHEDFLVQCHMAGQTKPTPLLLRYGPDDYNCLHQDLYGKQVFPLQVAMPRRRFHGWRIRAHGATAAHAIAGGSRAPGPRSRCYLSCPSPTGPGQPGDLPRQHAAWRQPLAVGVSSHRRYRLPRRDLN